MISEALPHSAPEINQRAQSPFQSFSSSPAKQLTPLAMLRLKKRAEQHEQVVAARAAMKQRLRDHAAADSFKKLSGQEQAAWWCGSSCSLDLAGLGEEYAEASRECALLSEGDGQFARLPAVPSPSPAVPQVVVRHLPPAAPPTPWSTLYWASLDHSSSLLCDGCDVEVPL